MIILVFLTLFLALPFLTGLYYMSTGIARKTSQDDVHRAFPGACMVRNMFFIYNGLYTVFTKGE